MEERSLANANLEKLRQNLYSGRGIAIGQNEAGLLIQVYWIGGRSENSRNRILSCVQSEGKVFTEAADPSKVTDPRLIIYNAMLERVHGLHRRVFAVSNGHQTDGIISANFGRKDFVKEMLKWEYEPDKPNFTPRISAIWHVEGNWADSMMASQRKSLLDDSCERTSYHTFPEKGLGHCLTTYSGDGDPLPSYRGGPYYVPLRGGIENIAETFWNALNKDTRVALAVKGIEPHSRQSRVHIINRFNKVA